MTVEDIAGIVADLQAQVSRLGARRDPPTPTPEPVASGGGDGAFWDCTYANGLTLTAGAALDWDPLFNNKGATDWMRYGLAAGSGSFDKGNLGFSVQRRWVLTWDAVTTRQVRCLLSGTSVYTADTDANIQVKMNGAMTEYVAGSGPDGNVAQMITVLVKEGRNRLAISADVAPDTVQFCGLLLTPEDSWVDPRTLEDYF